MVSGTALLDSERRGREWGRDNFLSFRSIDDIGQRIEGAARVAGALLCVAS